MSTDNPFAPGSTSEQRLRNTGGEMPPAEMEPAAILKRCWEITQANPSTVIGAFLITAVPQCGVNAVSQGLQVAADMAEPDVGLILLAGGLLVTLFGMVLSLYLQLGSVRIYTRLAWGIEAEVGMMFGEARYLLSAAGMSILMAVGVLGGFLLLVIPGIVLALGLQFALYAMVDQDLGPIAALQESWRLADGYKLTVFLVNFAIVCLIFLLGCLTFGMGFLLAAPVVVLTQAVMYHSLLHLRGPRMV